MQGPRTDQSLDPIPVTQQSFSGGMRDRDNPSLLDPNQYAYGKDIEIRDSGLAKMRDGRTNKTTSPGSFPQGGCRFRTNSGTEYLITVNAGKTYTWDGTSSSLTQIGSTVFNNTTTNVSFCVLNGTLFIAPGTGDNCYSWDGAAGSLTDEGNTNTDPPRCTLLCQQSGRIVSGGEAASNQDYLRFSDIFGGSTWDRTANNKRTPTDGSEAITSIVTYRKEEVLTQTAFSTHSWDISGSTVSNFSRITLDSKIGCIAPRSTVVVGDDAFFMSADLQVRTIKRTVQDLAFGVTNPITYFVPNLMARINPTYANLSAGIFFNNYYLLAVPFDSNTANSGIIPFDTLHQFATPSGSAPVCVGEWTNFSVNQFVVTYFSNIARLHYVDAVDGSIKQMFDGTTNDDGTSITPQVDFRSFDFGAPNYQKTGHDGEYQFVDSSGTASLYFKTDTGTWTLISSGTVGSTDGVLPINLPFNLPSNSGIVPTLYSLYRRGRSKYWQHRLTFTGSNMNLKQTTMNAWIEKFVTR